jgi:outer membrane lipoprotein carrier protein
MGKRAFVRGFGLSVCRSICLPALFFIFMLSPVSADIVGELKAKQAEIKTVSALFLQEKHTKLLTKPIKSSGRFFYKQPGMVRWEYSGSINMQVIYTGKELWLYYPDLKEADRLTGLPQYSSLMHFDLSSLSGDYTISAKKEKNASMLTLVPKIKGPVRKIEMEFSGQTSFPLAVRMTDSNNEETVIIFSDVRINKNISDEIFRFVPEKGITVKERNLE